MSAIVQDLVKLGLVAAIIAVHGYFVATEYALVTVRKTRIVQLANAGNGAATLVLDTLSRLPELIAAVQLGVTMASLALGALAEPTVATVLEPGLQFIPRSWTAVTAHGVAIALTFVLITAVDIIVAELVPKTIALQRSESIAMGVIRPIRAFMAAFHLTIVFLDRAGSLLIRSLGLAPRGEHGDAHTAEELKLIVGASTRAGVLDPDEQEMLVRVLEFSKLAARQVMVPRTEVIAFEVSDSREHVEEVLLNTRHTRYPVYRQSLDDILGILYVRDLLYRRQVPGQRFELRRLIREPLSVPDTKPIDDLLDTMRRSRVHIGVVYDEYGGTAGVVTLEDILERIVGEVRGEFEPQGQEVELLPQGDALIDGLVLVSDVNERFGLDLDVHVADTVGGFVMSGLGQIPTSGDVLEGDGYRLLVEEMDGRRVARVRLSVDATDSHETPEPIVRSTAESTGPPGAEDEPEHEANSA